MVLPTIDEIIQNPLILHDVEPRFIPNLIFITLQSLKTEYNIAEFKINCGDKISNSINIDSKLNADRNIKNIIATVPLDKTIYNFIIDKLPEYAEILKYNPTNQDLKIITFPTIDNILNDPSCINFDDPKWKAKVMTAVTKLHMEYCNSWVANGQILRIKNILKICEVNLDDTLITYFKELNKDYLS